MLLVETIIKLKRKFKAGGEVRFNSFVLLSSEIPIKKYSIDNEMCQDCGSVGVRSLDGGAFGVFEHRLSTR